VNNATCGVRGSVAHKPFDALRHESRLPTPHHRFRLARSPHDLGCPAAVLPRPIIHRRLVFGYGAGLTIGTPTEEPVVTAMAEVPLAIVFLKIYTPVAAVIGS
jgi:hypothetical protein